MTVIQIDDVIRILDLLEIANEYAEMAKYVEEKPAQGDENACEGVEVVQTLKTRCHEEMK